MRSRLSLKNSANTALCSLLATSLLLVSGCAPEKRMVFRLEDAPDAIELISKNEHHVTVHARIEGRTLWIYVPLEDVIVKAKKLTKSYEVFKIEENSISSAGDRLSAQYNITAVPKTALTNDTEFNKEALEKIRTVWKVLRTVLFKLNKEEADKIQFLCVLSADVKNGFLVNEVSYYKDLRKYFFQYIPPYEYEHRTIQKMDISDLIIGDYEGKTILYYDVPFEQFISAQIQNRIKLKFQKPEIPLNANIKIEVLKTINYVLDIYNLTSYTTVEINEAGVAEKVSYDRKTLKKMLAR